MAIVAADLLIKLSVTTGSAGNSTAQGNVNNSLGKYISTTQVTDNSLHNLFDVVSGTENAASESEYRCIFLHNSHATLTYYSAVVYVSSQVANGATISIGLDTTAASVIGDSSVQAVTVANEDTAPSGVTFSTPTTAGTGLSIGDLAPGTCKAIWIKRLTANTAALDSDGATLGFSGDTSA